MLPRVDGAHEVSKMKGALVFLAVFAVLLVVTLGYPSLPPGMQIYGMLGVPSSDYPVLGVPVTTLAAAVFNGVVYGVIVWLVFSVATGMGRKKEQKPTTPRPPP